jgi:hypothetical protein
MDRTKKPTGKESPERIEKRRRSLISNCLAQLGTALGQTIPPERILLYCRGLSDIGEAQLRHAFDQALKYLGDFLPSIQQLRLYASQWQQQDVIQDSRHILDRGDKPPDWEPLQAGELERIRLEGKTRADEIERQVSAAAHGFQMPKAPIDQPDAAEWERRRQAQLRAFRDKNREVGEA